MVAIVGARRPAPDPGRRRPALEQGGLRGPGRLARPGSRFRGPGPVPHPEGRAVMASGARSGQLMVVIDRSGTAEVAWDAAMALELPGLVAVYDVNGHDRGIMRPLDLPLDWACDQELDAPARPLAGVPPRFAVTIAPASEPWRPKSVLHRVTYIWAGILPYDTYEWSDHVPRTLTEAVARCGNRIEHGRQHAALRLTDRARRRRAELWGESVLLRALRPWQGRQFQTWRRFTVRAPSGRRYLVTAGRDRNVYALNAAGGPTAAYSLIPAVPGSLAEQLWQQTWLLERDEERFLRFALATQPEEGGERVR